MTISSDTISVLHVDDDPDFADLAATYLEREHDLDVATADSVREGLDHLDAETVDCIVSDYEMPDEDGLAFLRAVRETHPDLPFILYTGKGNEAIASDAISAGVTDYLQKDTGTSQYTVLANRITNAVTQYRAEQAAEATEEKLYQLTEHSDDALFMFDAEWRELLFVNSAYEDIWGGSIPELEADPRAFLEFVHPADIDALRQSMASVAQGSAESVEFRITTADSERRWVRGEGKPIFDDDGAVDRIVGYIRDITDQKERQRELERYERKYEAIFQDPNIFLGVLQPDGAVRNVNDTAMTYVDSDLDDVLGAPLWETPWWGDDGELQTAVERWVDRAADGEYVEFEADIAAAEEQRVVRGVLRPVMTDEGDVESIIVSSRDISQRKSREQELERLWDRVEFVLEATNSGIWEWDFATDTFERHGVNRLFDLPSDTTQPISLGDFFDRIHPEDRPAVEESFTELRTQETSHRVEFRVLTDEEADDGPYWLEDHAYARSNGDGSSEAVGLVTDITERKRREQAIQALHQMAQEIWQVETPAAVADIVVEAARDIVDMPINSVHLYDEDHDSLVPVAATERATEFLGEIPTFERGEGLAWEVFETGEPRRYTDVSTVPGRFNDETNARSELILPLPGHGVLHVGSPEAGAFDDTDFSLIQTLVAHATSALDQVERERRLTELQERSQRLMHTGTEAATAKAAVEAANDILNSPSSGVHLLTAGGDAMEPVAVVDTYRESFDPPTYHRDAVDDPISKLVWEVFESGESAVIDDVRAREDIGQESPAGSAIIHPLDEYGVFIVTSSQSNAFAAADVTYVELVATSLTAALDRVQRETNLQERERDLERQNERLEKFANIVSHDLRNPLNVAQGRLELVRDSCECEHLDAIGSAHERMDALITDLLTLARDGGTATDIEPVDVASLAAACWQNVDTKNATLDDRLDRTIQADEGLLRQLFENLIRNAVEHGGADVTVTVGDLADGFYVADTGPGIPAADREAVFEAGYSTGDQGTGFGLSIVQQVVDAHDWAVRVTESEAGGARFEITGVDAAE